MSDFVFDPSYAVECSRVRPDWTPDDGRTTSLVEFVNLLVTPLGLMWLALLILLLVIRSGWLGAVFSIACLALSVAWIARYSLDDNLYLASVGGCVGSLNATLTALALGFLCGIAIAAIRLRQRLRSRAGS